MDDEYFGDRTDDASYEDDTYDYDAEANAAIGNYLASNFPELSGDAALTSKLGGVLQNVGADAFNALKNTFMKDGKVDWRSVAGAAGGLYGIYQANKPQEKVGYQGGIPKYEAVRERVPMTYDATRRAGSSGQQYFTAPQFVKQSDTDAVKAAREAAAKDAATIATTNYGNFARHPDIIAALRGQNLPPSTPITSPAGGGTAVAATPRAASSVSQDLKVPVYTEANARGVQMASGGLAGMAQGRYLGGATDGMADKIPARIGDKQEARLSHGEFVIPADVVSHLGNGNSEAGAKRLYAMMDKIRTARTGTKKQGKQINPDKFLA
jgi:hypothetical protein